MVAGSPVPSPSAVHGDSPGRGKSRADSSHTQAAPKPRSVAGNTAPPLPPADAPGSDRRVSAPAWSRFGPHPIGSERFAAVSSGTSLAQVADEILRKRPGVQNRDKDEVPGSSPGRPTSESASSAAACYSSGPLGPAPTPMASVLAPPVRRRNARTARSTQPTSTAVTKTTQIGSSGGIARPLDQVVVTGRDRARAARWWWPAAIDLEASGDLPAASVVPMTRRAGAR
jgi:hypothetical protein